MFDVLQTIKEEFVDDGFISKCKEIVGKFTVQSTIIFVCNSKLARRHLMTIATQDMFEDGWRMFIKDIARRSEADAIVTVITQGHVDKQMCMAIIVETLLGRYARVYPYKRVSQQVTWQEPQQLELPSHYGDLLPAPAGMAQA